MNLRPSIMPRMFLRAGALSLALLLASRLLGLLRESAQAAAFGASGLADVAVLMLTLPDWLAGVLASGALAYVMLPAWSAQQPEVVAASQRRLVRMLVAGGVGLAIVLAMLRYDALDLLVPGLTPVLHEPGTRGLLWSAAALPMALMASLWATRLQHERDFAGMYGANLVVNGVLVATLYLLFASSADARTAVPALGWGLLVAMGLRLLWLYRRMPASVAPIADGQAALPAVSVWLWAAAAAGLPLTLPFAARSIGSAGGEGALATFNYAWKLVELPLMLAIQLVATLAFPGVARAFSTAARSPSEAAAAVRPAFALAWTLACAAAAGLIVGTPALADLLFGWGRMDPKSLATVAAWGAIGAWGLLPQSLIAVAVTILAARRRMHAAVFAYAGALALLFAAAAGGMSDGAGLMHTVNGLFLLVALVVLPACGRALLSWLPWAAMLAASLALGACALAVLRFDAIHAAPMALQLAAAVLAASIVVAVAFLCSADLRMALRR